MSEGYKAGRQRNGVRAAGVKVIVWRGALTWGWLWWHFILCLLSLQ